MKKRKILLASIATIGVVAAIYSVQPSPTIIETNPKLYEAHIAKHLTENKAIRDKINHYLKTMNFKVEDCSNHFQVLNNYHKELSNSMKRFRKVDYTNSVIIPQMHTYTLLFEKYDELMVSLNQLILFLQEEDMASVKAQASIIRELNKQILKIESIFYYYEID